MVVTHIDADGLSSGSIAFSALARKNFAVSVRAIPDLDPRAIEKLKADRFEFYLFTDLGSGLLGELSKAFGEGFVVVDHHQVPDSDSVPPAPDQRVELRLRRRQRGMLFHDGLRLRQGRRRAGEPRPLSPRPRRRARRPAGQGGGPLPRGAQQGRPRRRGLEGAGRASRRTSSSTGGRRGRSTRPSP